VQCIYRHTPNFYQWIERLALKHFGAGLFTDVEITYPATERSLAGLDQIKNPNYSEAEGRCEMFERSSEGMHLS
jgi:hypothetical protein